MELPQITPPRPENRLTINSTTLDSSKHMKDIRSESKLKSNLTNPEISKFVKDFTNANSKDIPLRNNVQRPSDSTSYEEYFPISSSRSYEDSRSLDDYKTRPWSTRRSSSPFSSDSSSFDSSRYYRWRNTSYAKVTGSPHIAESIDYTIVNPESTPLQDDEGLGFPKNIIISSKTPMISGPEILVKKGTKRKPITIDSKLDEESMSVVDDNQKVSYEEEQEENISETTEKAYEESDELPKPDFETSNEEEIMENEDEYNEDDTGKLTMISCNIT